MKNNLLVSKASLLVLAGVLSLGAPSPDCAWSQHPGGAAARAQLEAGKFAYDRYCAGCHGAKGDGKGPAAKFLNPQPRDFISGKFKFASVPSGELPADEDLLRTITRGLHGTSMPAWNLLPEHQRLALVAYLKTFAPRWKEEPPGTPIQIPEDPYRGSAADIRKAVKEGEKLYHTLTVCWQCHPGYVAPSQIAAWAKEANQPFTSVRPNWYQPVVKEDGWGQMLKPTHFATDRIKTGLELNSLFRIIAAGVGGTAMPTWKNTIKDEQIWAVAYYVRSLADQRNNPLRNLPLSSPTPAAPPPAQAAAAPAPVAASAAAPAKAAESKPAPAKAAATNPYE
ncbi:MAG: c-type cytochrome [Verrucomicrobia bacterium]|nr:c-type cytochrome [Verrucomicrobiota bacterium]